MPVNASGRVFVQFLSSFHLEESAIKTDQLNFTFLCFFNLFRVLKHVTPYVDVARILKWLYNSRELAGVGVVLNQKVKLSSPFSTFIQED